MESREKVGELKANLQEASEVGKCCSICRTTKTPLWRSGPTGPKSLCNACGIRFRKKPGNEVKTTKGKGKRRSLKVMKGLVMVPLGSGKGSTGMRRRPPGQWGEVERAALLLMALSCGAVFA